MELKGICKRVVRGEGLECGQKGLVLLAAKRLSDIGSTPFTTAQLVVEAWKHDQAEFGLAGFERLYPDSSKVEAALMGVYGLVGKRLLARMAPKTYQITTLGEEETGRYLGTITSPKPKRGQAKEKLIEEAMRPDRGNADRAFLETVDVALATSSFSNTLANLLVVLGTSVNERRDRADEKAATTRRRLMEVAGGEDEQNAARARLAMNTLGLLEAKHERSLKVFFRGH